ncbi:hypothetical protein [uncultured Bacteroides sp.]|uniref:hypothetical protein n=1 Tax=uncultured Bacteroides sp. TaxID=162156 RepID=UPI002620D9DD|nr:hypothetical protein [uncultured Bacteroides sp.]
MRKILLLVVCVLCSLAGYSQNFDEPKGKPTVFIDYFKRSGDSSFAWVEGLRNTVIEGIQKMERVILIDVDAQDALRIEAQRRSSANISSGDDNEMDRLAVMEQLGAQFIITGQVASMTAAYKSKDGKSYYDGSVSYTLKVINAKNGTLVGTKTFQHSGLTGGTGANKEEAIANTIKYAVHSMRDFVDEYFKMEGTILEVNSEKKGKAEEVYINLGTMHGVKDAQKFTVYVVREVAGREAKREIGRLTVKAVEGDDISLCKVQKGGEEIMKAIRDEQPIKIISRVQTLMGGIFN